MKSSMEIWNCNLLFFLKKRVGIFRQCTSFCGTLPFLYETISYFCDMNEYKKLKIEITDDGSATILVTDLDEHYHSVKGAFTESNHIYRDSGFLYRSNKEPYIPIRLLEVGFGTGLNAVVTAMAADARNPVHYITMEKFPLDKIMIDELNYGELVNSKLYSAIHEAEWNVPVEITPHFIVEKRNEDYLSSELPQNIDVVYFDAFAPEKQPEMWSLQAFERLERVMNPDSVLTTYCAKGEIRRMLASLGLFVERLPGPVGGKREILRATKKVKDA